MFNKNDIINNEYEVLFPIQNTSYGSSYRVRRIENGKVFMLKIYEKNKLNSWHFNEDGDLLEAEIHKQINHPNISKFISCKMINFQNQEIYLYVVDFISGETLQERIDREGLQSVLFVKNIINKVMSAVSYLHELHNPIIHGDITPLNIMLDLGSDNVEPILFDFGLSKQKNHSTSYNGTVPSIFYCSSELFDGNFSIKSDVFSLGALYYMLLEGYFPFHEQFTVSDINSVDLKEKIINSRQSKLTFNPTNNHDEQIKLSIIKSLLNIESRFESVNDFYLSINKEKLISHEEIKKEELKNVLLKKEGGGFSKIAGMDNLKELINEKIIEPLKDPESYKDYGIEPPNGILFYGPPGCGKTFFAECLSEELGFNFIKIDPSTVASKYVHGGKEKIKSIFDAAKENAPTILFIDEIEGIIPNRESADVGHHYASEVNEWLVQLNNCGKHNIFVIAATNIMENMDPAILRTGRFDEKILVPMPDLQSRKSLIQLFLNKRKKVVSDNIDYEKLSKLTEGYNCKDIDVIINNASRIALKNKSKISDEFIIKVIEQTAPSATNEQIAKYSKGERAENKKSKKIGFRQKS